MRSYRKKILTTAPTLAREVVLDLGLAIAETVVVTS